MKEPNSENCRIDFEPIAKRVNVATGTTLLAAAQQAGLVMASACGGLGKCGQCRVTVMEGEVSLPEENEKTILAEDAVARGERLACHVRVFGPVKVHVPESSLLTRQRLQLEGDGAALDVDPVVESISLELPPPSLEDAGSDFGRVISAVHDATGNRLLHAEPSVIRQLSPMLREHQWRLSAYIRQGALVGVAPLDTPPLGVAIDLGTTKIAACLLDLVSGEEIATAGAMNPQISYGEDVVSRLTYACRNETGAEILAGKVRECLDELIGQLTEIAGVKRDRVAELCIVGNTAMTHLLVRLPVRQLSSSPYVAAVNESMDLRASDLGLRTAPGAFVHILPCIGGFVGADHVAMIQASNIDEADSPVIGIDIGTNSEIVLADPRRKDQGEKRYLLSASCASGPAFEGGHISDGMRAASGAIEAVRLTENEILVNTVDAKPAIGLCGSGIVDTLAEFRRWNVINPSGRLERENRRVRKGANGYEVVLVSGENSGSGRDVVITQEDINQVQLAKGAIRAGLDALLAVTDTDPAAVKEVFIAGAFGSFLNVAHTIDIGLFPRLPNATYRQVGNAAIVGAKMNLLSWKSRNRASRIVLGSRHLELTTYDKFTRLFALGMQFPKPLEEIK